MARPELPPHPVGRGRGKLAALAAFFALPIAASVITYAWLRPEGGASYGELLLPPAMVSAQPFTRQTGGVFEFGELAGKWVLVVSDSGACEGACREKLTLLRQVRLALGRDAARVERVFVVDDARAPAPGALADFGGSVVAIASAPRAVDPAVGDRGHIYLVDPHGNVMMRWPAAADGRRMLGDLRRLLKASQIG